MTVIRFTDLTIRSLPQGQYFDMRTPSFGFLVGKRRKTWFVIKGANRTKMRIGHWPLSLAEARKRALMAIGSPLESSQCPTFPEVREQYLGQGEWRPRTRFETARLLNKHFHWTKTIDKITHRDVAEAVDAIQAPSGKRNASMKIRALFSWCMPRYLQNNPCAGLRAPSRNTPRTRVLSDDELRRVWTTTTSMGDFGCIIQLCVTTGQRIGEIRNFQQSWLKENSLVIPASVAKNGRSHTLPLSQTSRRLFSKLHVTHSMSSINRQKKKLDFASGVTDWVIHDLRRTYATSMQRLGTRLEVTEKLLNHVSGSMAGIISIYQRHDFWPEMQEAVAKHEQHLLSLLAH